jgi:hypothetical protein
MHIYKAYRLALVASLALGVVLLLASLGGI